MIDSGFVEALQVLALKAAEKPSYEDWYRRTCRWYSREFNTPLMDVYDLPEEEVFKTYFEDLYYEMRQSKEDEGKERYERLRDILIGGEKVVKEMKEEAERIEAEDEDWYQQELEQIRAEEEAAFKAKQAKKTGEMPEPNLEGIKIGVPEVQSSGEDPTNSFEDD